MEKLTNISRKRLVLLHVILWICFLFFPLLIYKVDFFNVPFFKRDLINNVFLILLFYFNFYVLIPFYFEKRKFAVYFSLIIACLLVFSCQQVFTEFSFMPPYANRPHHLYLPGAHSNENTFRDSFFAYRPRMQSGDTAHFQPMPMEQRQHPGPFLLNRPVFFWIESFRKALLSVLTILFTSGFIRVAIQWYNTEKRNEKLEIKRLNVELDLLKAQINPHFLFNTLNTVYALAHRQSPQTEAVILKLSEILRYVIYESSAQKVLLRKELSYIENYFELQKYRLDKNYNTDYSCEGDVHGLWIEPMLLIPFIENAFKHSTGYSEEAFIIVKIITKANELSLLVGNTFNHDIKTESHTGIGLENVKKRLELGYSGRYELTLSEENNIYTINLKILLHHD